MVRNFSDCSSRPSVREIWPFLSMTVESFCAKIRGPDSDSAIIDKSGHRDESGGDLHVGWRLQSARSPTVHAPQRGARSRLFPRHHAHHGAPTDRARPATAAQRRGACGCHDPRKRCPHLWNGNVGRALILVEDFTDGFDLISDPPAAVRKLRRYLEEFSRCIDNNADLIPNYAERRRYGEVVSTAFVESTVNQVIAKKGSEQEQCEIVR